MEIIFRPEAEAELFEAQAWYESRSQGLGIEFAQAVTVAVESVLRMPFAYPRQFAT
uniref:Plasmid stabilization system protein n=1 Tax=Chlorobium chlorochromatii (strain CaD3) TaxID=340177 RepID=Q3ATU4_CHLCH